MNLKLLCKKNLKIMIYFIMFVIFVLMHIPLKYVSDDRWHIQNQLSTVSIKDFIILQYNYNGRFLTDGLAYVFYHMPFRIWKLINPLIICLSARLIAKQFTRDSFKDNIMVCLLVLTFPLAYMKSAGYIASSTNYIYTMVATLIALLPITYVRVTRNKISIPLCIIVIPAILYLCNHDQYGLIFLMGLTFYLIYIILCKFGIVTYSTFDKCEIKLILCIYITTLIVYGLMFNTPGHRFRMNNDAEWQYWFPQYADWELKDKIIHGYTSTVANLFFRDSKPVIVFLLILAILAFFKFYCSKDTSLLDYVKLGIGISPLTLQIAIKLFGYKRFVSKHKYTYGMFDLDNLYEKRYIVAFAVSIIMLLLILLSVIILVDKIERKLFMLLLLILGAASHEMMGFSGTIYASNLRTFTLLLYMIIISAVLLVNEIHDTVNERDSEKNNIIDMCISFVICGVAFWA